MKKIQTSLGCANCNSSNIEYSVEFCNEEMNFIKNENAKIITRQKIYNCKCNNCGHKYTVNHGNENTFYLNNLILLIV